MPSEEREETNAKSISADPEVLKMLKRLLPVLKTSISKEVWGGWNYSKLYNDTKLVIKKAEANQAHQRTKDKHEQI